jgi:hypothetical protein
MIFLDRNHDGLRSSDEEGIAEIRVLLLRGEEKVAEGLTDKTGDFGMPEIPPGAYALRIADGWLPSAWEVTTGTQSPVTVGWNESAEAKPIGIAPKRKPIIRTYSGESR